MKRGQAIHGVYAAHGVSDGCGGLARCPRNRRVVFATERDVCRAMTQLRALGDLVGHYRCDHGEHWHITNVAGTTAKQRKNLRRRYGRAWVVRRPWRQLGADT